MVKYLTVICFLSLTVVSFNPYASIVSLMASIACLLLGSYSNKITKNIAYPLFTVILLMVSMVIYSLFVYVTNSSSEYTAFSTSEAINNLILKISAILTTLFLVIKMLGSDYRKDSFEIFSLALKVHVLFFLFQYITLEVFGYYIDAVKFITGEESRYINVWSDDSTGFFKYRPTGLLVEPSTYSAIVISLLLGRFSLNRKFDLLGITSVGTIILTGSSAGVVFVLIFIVIALINSGLFNSKFIQSIIFFSAIILMIIYGEQILFSISERSLFTISNRTNTISLIFERDWYELLFGKGFLVLESSIYYDNLKDSRSYVSINDIGFIFYSISSYLFLFVGLIASTLYFIRVNIIATLMVLLLFMTKLSFEHTILWITLLTIIFTVEKKSKGIS